MKKIGWATKITITLSFFAAVPTAARDAADLWRELTSQDVEAAYRLLLENHPASAPELGDTDFQRNLEKAHSLARQRLPQATTPAAHDAVLRGFAYGLGDKHIGYWNRYQPNRFNFPGFVVGFRGGYWQVVEETDAIARLLGASLTSCDGTAAETLAQQRLGGFRAVWSIGAQRIESAPWLLIDDGNPYLPVIDRCTFTSGGDTRTITLNWRPIDWGSLQPMLDRAVRGGVAGFDVRPIKDGWWIGIESFNDEARKVIDLARIHASNIRRSRIIVVDLRGNLGGGSIYGRQLAEIIYGADFVEERLGTSSEEGCGSVWRASPGNIESARQFIARSGADRGPEFVREFQKAVDAMSNAIQAAQKFTGPTQCQTQDLSVQRGSGASQPQTRASVFLLTDHRCFSSCLGVTQYFRELGAIHVGETTDAATRYQEVRSQLLPSGMGSFSTLQKVALGVPFNLGPFTPAIEFDGDISDTRKLEQWLLSLVVPTR